MRIDTNQVLITKTWNGLNLNIVAWYKNQEIGGLYIKQDYDEEEVLNFIGDDDEEAPEPEPFIYLNLIEVYPEYRQNGIATLLMNYFFENEIYNNFPENNTYMKLVVHPQGLGITKNILYHFYAQYGFEKSINNFMVKYI